MRLSLLPASLLAGASIALASACTTPTYISPVEVTRFVGNAPASLGQGTIVLEPAPGTAPGPQLAIYMAAITAELEQLGYDVVAGNGAQIAAISLEQYSGSPGDNRGPVSVGGSASTGTYGSGVGLGIGIDLTPREADRIDTWLSLSIRPADGGANLWEGRANMSVSVNTSLADDTPAAARLATALLQDFPGMSGETITVE